MYLYSFFNLHARWWGWSTLRSGRFTPDKDPLYRRLGGPRAGLDGCEKYCPHRD